MDVENVTERNERLGAHSRRQERMSALLAKFEEPAPLAEGDLEAFRMLTVDALMDNDDYALRLAVDGLHRVLVIWTVSTEESDVDVVEDRGELRGIHNVASMALERMVPMGALAEIAPGTRPHEMLAYIVENAGCSNDDLVHHTGADKTQISRAGRRLHDLGLVRKRRTGTRNTWQATPRGVGALHATAARWPRPAGRQPTVA